jgi:Tol biopolymer transport system component
MRTNTWIALVMSVVLVLALGAAQKDTQKDFRAEAQLQAAINKETVEGDLKGAIEQYKAIAVLPDAGRATVATALLRMGQCHEKLGAADTEEARKVYEQVVRDFGDQTDVVVVAQERLDNILRAASLAKKGEQDITIRKVPTPKGFTVTGAVSPDGKYLADIGENECDLRITEILTGRQRFLTTRGECSWSPRWSPDSTKLAVAHKPGLCVIALDGSAPRVLVDLSADDRRFEPLDWSPDGKYILILAWSASGKAPEVSLVTVADGSVRSLKTEVFRAMGLDYRFSPDGLYVVYSRPVTQDDLKRDVYLLSVDGTRETPLIQHAADDAFLEWLPDGRGILFASNRAGTDDLWSIQIDKGQPQGAPTLVRRSIGPITPMRLTKGGAFYYETPASFMDVYTVSLDPNTGNVTGPSKKEPLTYQGHNRWPDWSPDGRHLAYVSVRPTIVGPFFPGRARESLVCIYSADTGRVREYPGVRASSTRWSQDGRYLYVTASNVGGGGIHRINFESGEVMPFLLKANGGGVQVSADGQWVVYCRDRRIQRRNVRSGEEKELDGPDVYPVHLALSTDGGRLAWVLKSDEKTWVLKVMAFPDGTPREIQRLRDPYSRIGWSPDGRFIYYSDVPPAGGSNYHLWRVPADGGPAQELGFRAPSLEHLSVHPDGSRITFSTETLNPEPPQLWVMENFLPPAKVVK